MLSPPSTTKLCFNSNNNNNNVRFNSIIPAGQSWQFFLIRSCVRILSSAAISFHILLYALLLQFSWLTLLLFLSYLKLHNLTYLEINVSTHDMTIPLQAVSNYQILDLHNNTYPILKNISRHPINESHPTHHPDHTTFHSTQPRLIRTSKFPLFTIAQQNWSYTTLINPSPLLQR